MPSPSIRSDSSANGRLQRLTMNPGASVQRTGVRPIRSATSTVAASAGSAVDSPATTSTSFISAGGLKKCMPQIRSGRAASAAIALTESEEVLVASTASAPQAASRRGEQVALELELLGRGLDHDAAAGRGPRARPPRRTPRGRRLGLGGAPAIALGAARRGRRAAARAPRSSASGCGS